MNKRVLSLVDKYIEGKTWKLYENANRIFCIGGCKTFIAEEVIREYTLRKLPPEAARAHKDGAIHIHDLAHGVAPYSFYRNEVIIVRRKSDEKVFVTSFEQLFESIQSEVIEENGYQIKYTDEYEILDENGWTPLIRVLRHKAETPLVSISTRNGENVVVTADHPFIIIKHKKPQYPCPYCKSENIYKDGSNKNGFDWFKCRDCSRRFKRPRERIYDRRREIILAEKVEKGNYVITPILQIDRKITDQIDSEDAWFIGFFIAEGWQNKYRLCISQNADTSEYKKLIDYLNRRQIRYTVYDNDVYINKSSLPTEIRKIIESIRNGAENKNLPIDFLNYSDKIIGGIISGIIDGDGVIQSDEYATCISLRMTARTLLSQIFIWMKINNINAHLRPINKQSAREYEGRIIEQKKQMYELSFYLGREKLPLFNESIKIKKKFKILNKSKIYSEYTYVIGLKEIANDDEWVYDITTETHTFLCNGILVHNCAGWGLLNLLLNGLRNGPNTTHSRPPKHLSSALGQMLNFLGLVSQEWAGAQAFNSVDTLLAPFVFYDKLSYKEVKQEIQEFIFGLNQVCRFGHETIFSNVTFDVAVPDDLANAPVIIGGEPQDKTYAEFDEERQMITKAFLEVLIEGDGRGGIFRFPIPTFNIVKDFPWDTEVGEKLAEVAGRFGLPYFQNCISSELSPTDVRAMCCFSGQTLVFWRKNGNVHLTTFQRLYQHHRYDEIETLYNGGWVKCRVIQVPYDRPFYKIRLRNGFEFIVTDDHEHVTRAGIKKTSELTTDDYLAWSKKSVEWKGVGDYDFGYFLGLYLAEGSHLGRNTIQFSIGADENDIKDFIVEYAHKLGASTTIEPNKGDSISVFIHSKYIRELIDSWIGGEKAPEKYIKNWVKLSREALQGLWDGWMRGDGHKNREIYTSSKRLAEEALCIANILNIPVSLRTDKHTARFGEKEYDGIIYAIHICKDSSERGRIYYSGESLYIYSDYYWVKIESIEKVNNSQKKAYCFEVFTDEHLFELPQGLITHNCRLNLDLNELRRKSGGLFGYNDETGSIGVVTINLSQLGYLSHSESEFFERLDEILVIAKEALECKRKIIQKTFDRGLLPYTKQYLRGFDNHFSTIGVIAGEEMCQNLLGCSIATEIGRDFAIQVLKYIRERIKEFQEETGNLYNLEATPAEGASYRLARIDRKKFGRKIYVSGSKTRPLYTNSTLLPYDHNLDLISVLDHQEPLQTLYSGGTVMHIYLGEQLPKEECKYIVSNFIEWLCTNWKIPYYTLTPTYSVCRACGKTHSGVVQKCPDCKQSCEIYSRVVGYYSPIQAWNPGKREEFKRRTVYMSLENAMNP
ncbi:hypothetical protein DRN85_07690 [Methanosarcinales archaeon]|nr:MAG: hypothetical protein DRN85_07690 [Methanosarcinales archaeon]